MMFWSEKLRVVLATIHIPLASVPAALTIESVSGIIELTNRELPRFGIARPRLALAGLNPHAGEHGILGREETDVLEPAVARSAKAGIDISGPFPGDTIFLRAMRGEFDAVIACYHDQGLIPIKMAAFGQAVNVTLGLPIIRTSVDHGTAFDIAGKDIADPESMVQAVLLAAQAGRWLILLNWRLVPVFAAFLPEEVDPGKASKNAQAHNRKHRQEVFDRSSPPHFFLNCSNAMPARE